MFLHAYFDASKRETGTYCVAGYAFTPRQAKNFARDWRKMLGSIPYFRTADLLAKQGVFRGISDAKKDRTLKRAVAIIRERAMVSVAVLCQQQELETMEPKLSRGLGAPFPVCCHFCMALLGKWMDKRSPGEGDIAYFFEQGDEGEGDASELMGLAGSTAGVAGGLNKLYRYRSHAFIGKKDAAPLQAADLLAWEWTKVKDETVDQSIRPVRHSLRALMSGNPDNFLERHLTGVHLKIYFEKMEGIDVLPERGGGQS